MIIIGILAAVAIPMMSNFRKRAMATEALQALATIRTAEKIYHMEHDGYTTPSNPETFEDIGMMPGDLDGVYFDEDCYRVFYYLWNASVGYIALCRTSRSSHPEVSNWQYSGGLLAEPYIAPGLDSGKVYTNIIGLESLNTN